MTDYITKILATFIGVGALCLGANDIGRHQGEDLQKPKEVTVAKVNKDSIEDLVITSNNGDKTIMIGIGNGKYISLIEYEQGKRDSLKSGYKAKSDSLEKEMSGYNIK